MTTVAETYDERFYAAMETGSLRSARVVVPQLMRLINPGSVIDIGCGTGAWLSVFVDHGVPEVAGLDGGTVAPHQLHISPDQFRQVDLVEPLMLDRTYDLALCLEVAEHLPLTAADTLVESLTRAAPVVVFSAAVPHQGGVEHLNEQWQDWWAQRFRTRHYTASDVLRSRLWDDPDVEWWYAQNILIYVRDDQIERYPLLFSGASDSPLSVAHPRMVDSRRYEMDAAGRSLKQATRQWVQAARRAVLRRLGMLK